MPSLGFDCQPLTEILDIIPKLQGLISLGLKISCLSSNKYDSNFYTKLKNAFKSLEHLKELKMELICLGNFELWDHLTEVFQNLSSLESFSLLLEPEFDIPNTNVKKNSVNFLKALLSFQNLRTFSLWLGDKKLGFTQFDIQNQDFLDLCRIICQLQKLENLCITLNTRTKVLDTAIPEILMDFVKLRKLNKLHLRFLQDDFLFGFKEYRDYKLDYVLLRLMHFDDIVIQKGPINVQSRRE